jgi:hypothetical protein
MKKVIFAVLFILPILVSAQAHLGSTLAEIKESHPDNVFTIDYTNQGQKYAQSEMYYGTFVYYFDNETGLSVILPFCWTKRLCC